MDEKTQTSTYSIVAAFRKALDRNKQGKTLRPVSRFYGMDSPSARAEAGMAAARKALADGTELQFIAKYYRRVTDSCWDEPAKDAVYAKEGEGGAAVMPVDAKDEDDDDGDSGRDFPVAAAAAAAAAADTVITYPPSPLTEKIKQRLADTLALKQIERDAYSRASLQRLLRAIRLNQSVPKRTGRFFRLLQSDELAAAIQANADGGQVLDDYIRRVCPPTAVYAQKYADEDAHIRAKYQRSAERTALVVAFDTILSHGGEAPKGTRFEFMTMTDATVAREAWTRMSQAELNEFIRTNYPLSRIVPPPALMPAEPLAPLPPLVATPVIVPPPQQPLSPPPAPATVPPAVPRPPSPPSMIVDNDDDTTDRPWKRLKLQQEELQKQLDACDAKVEAVEKSVAAMREWEEKTKAAEAALRDAKATAERLEKENAERVNVEHQKIDALSRAIQARTAKIDGLVAVANAMLPASQYEARVKALADEKAKYDAAIKKMKRKSVDS